MGNARSMATTGIAGARVWLAGAAIALLGCAPASAAPAPPGVSDAPMLPELRWPSGTRQHDLDGMRVMGVPTAVRVLDIPLPIAGALDAIVAASAAPMRVQVQQGRLIVGPGDAGWLLALTARGERTSGLLSAMAPESVPPSPPSWLPPGMRLRLHARADGATQQIYTHAGQPPRAMATQIFARLAVDGWRAEQAGSGQAVSHWRRGRARMALAVVALDAGSGVYVTIMEEGSR